MRQTRLPRHATAGALEQIGRLGIHNFLIGVNTLDLDVKRAAETIGWATRRAYDRLRCCNRRVYRVRPGVLREPTGVKVGEVRSRHIGASPILSVPDSVKPEDAARHRQPRAGERDEHRGTDHRPGFNAVRAFVRDNAFLIAGQVMQELRKLTPLGANIDELAAHMKLDRPELTAALVHLEQYDIIEISDGAARVAPKFYLGGVSMSEITPVSHSRRAGGTRLVFPLLVFLVATANGSGAKRKTRSSASGFLALTLPNRTRTAIYGQVNKLGLSREGRPAPKQKHDRAALDAEILKARQDFEKPARAVNGVKALMQQLGKPLWIISQRCVRLGLTCGSPTPRSCQR